MHKIVEARLILREQNVEKSSQSISTEIGLQTVQVKDLEKGKAYVLHVSAKNEGKQGDGKSLNFKMD